MKYEDFRDLLIVFFLIVFALFFFMFVDGCDASDRTELEQIGQQLGYPLAASYFSVSLYRNIAIAEGLDEDQVKTKKQVGMFLAGSVGIVLCV